MLEVTIIQWLDKIEFRRDESLQQSAPMASSQKSSNHTSSNTSCQERSTSGTSHKGATFGRPLLEVPTFSGNYREFSTLWSVFESLIHSDDDLSDQEKFLFLKQAFKGKAASSLSSIPVMGKEYITAITLLKKHYDRSASIANILINEIERLPRAQGYPRSCRETLAAISPRVTLLEQTGTSMNAHRMWRRLILSKFTESICATVIRMETPSM
ncbi:hypothetical protein V3C99_018619 [Haemonchus contortus]|uniref:Uncharacterized protein n=1 Tax=Haemonchus contortus TaxID=6289 RepID=A0A7I4Z222_HAECO